MDGVTETLKSGTEGDSGTGECIMTTAPSTNNKKASGDDGNVMGKLGKLISIRKSKCMH